MNRPISQSKSLYFDYPKYGFKRAPEQEGLTSVHPVVIVGGGPVGVTAALELARHGVRSVVLDDKDTVNEGSRAICIARHSVECLQQLGLADRFEEKALAWTSGTSYYRGKPVYRLQMPHSDTDRYYPMYNLQQQYIEKFLIDEAHGNKLIDLRWQSRVTDVEQDYTGVRLHVETPEGKYTIDSNYLLAADGAHSVVRRSLGLALNGEAYEGRYVIVDIQMASDYPTERRAFFDPPSNPGLTILIHRQPDNIWRIDYQVGEDVDEEKELSEDNIRRRISAVLEMIGETGKWQLEWWSLYKAYSLALDDYRHGNILFIGDAAHLVPIFGVRGLNSGFADAMNAAWKLAWVIKGWADEKLLNSYSPERRGATLEVFENAIKSTKFMTPPTRGHHLMRDATLSLAVSNAFARPLINPRQSQPYTYMDSPLTALRKRDAEFECGPGAGAALLDFRFSVTESLLDHVGPGFSGLYFSDSGVVDAQLSGLCGELRVGNVQFALTVITRASPVPGSSSLLLDVDGALFSAYGAGNGTFYLVRPDRHISARWKEIKIDEVRQVFARTLHGGTNE